MDRTKANKTLAAILLTVAEVPDGAPAGPLYAALMGTGITLSDFQGLVGIAEEVGLVTQSGHVLHATPKGRELAKRIAAGGTR